LDEAGQRVFMGCANAQMTVVDTHSGHVVAELPIGAGNDAVAFDPVRKRVFSSNGRDGTVSIYRQLSPDKYEALASIKTAISARTMAVDARTGRLFVVAADGALSVTPGGRPSIRPGTARMMIYDPIG
jgi:DNA-binding beta-propeller fold protein YncE